MGDYIYMQGTAKIKPQYIKPLQAFFNTRHDDPDYELVWGSLQQDLPELITYSAYYVLTNGRSSSVPFGMANPTAWPNHFDGIVDELGTLDLSDDGQLAFKCSNRNRNMVFEAFICLLPVFADDWQVDVDYSEWSWGHVREGQGVTVYTPGSASMDVALDKVCVVHRDMIKEQLKRDAAKIVGAFTQEDLEEMADKLGISREVLRNPPAAVYAATLKFEQPGFDAAAFESELREKLVAAMGLSQEFMRVDDPDSKLFGNGVPSEDSRQVPVTKFNPTDSILDHINAQKLYARGKMGVRQLTRKSRRTMRS